MLKSNGPYKQQVSGNFICEAPVLPYIPWGRSTTVGVNKSYAIPTNYTTPKKGRINHDIIGGALSPVEVQTLEKSMDRFSQALDILGQR
jgi:hypothetical protein